MRIFLGFDGAKREFVDVCAGNKCFFAFASENRDPQFGVGP